MCVVFFRIKTSGSRSCIKPTITRRPSWAPAWSTIRAIHWTGLIEVKTSCGLSHPTKEITFLSGSTHLKLLKGESTTWAHSSLVKEVWLLCLLLHSSSLGLCQWQHTKIEVTFVPDSRSKREMWPLSESEQWRRSGHCPSQYGKGGVAFVHVSGWCFYRYGSRHFKNSKKSLIFLNRLKKSSVRLLWLVLFFFTLIYIFANLHDIDVF